MPDRTRCVFCGKWTNFSETTCVSCSRDPLDRISSKDDDVPRPWDDPEEVDQE